MTSSQTEVTKSNAILEPSTSIAIVIPAFRAALTIRSVIEQIPPLVSYIIIVNDGSPDATEDAVRAITDPRVSLISHYQNRGVGAATLTGYERALNLGAEIIVKMDSDDQMDPQHLPRLIGPILAGQADYTKGNRFLHARQLRTMPLKRRLGNAGLSFLTKLASGYWNIFDPTNGYTAIHRSIIPLLDREGLDPRYFFESSMLIQLNLSRAVVEDVYIPARYPGTTSSLSERRALLEFPRRLAGAAMKRVLVQYFVRDFTALSLYLLSGTVLVLFGAGWGLWHWARSASLDIGTPTGTVMISVLPLMLGFQLLLQAATLDIQSVPTRPVHPTIRAN